MIQHRIKSTIAVTACAVVATLVFLGAAHAGADPLDECRKWADTGEDMRCFDCFETVGSGDNQRWVNVCNNLEGGHERNERYFSPSR